MTWGFGEEEGDSLAGSLAGWFVRKLFGGRGRCERV